MDSSSKRGNCSTSDLDFTSENFDPLKALYCKNMKLPFPNAKTYNNVAEYYSHFFLKKEAKDVPAKDKPYERDFSFYYWSLNIKNQRQLDNFLSAAARRKKMGGKLAKYRDRRANTCPLQRVFQRWSGKPNNADAYERIRSSKVIRVRQDFNFPSGHKRSCSRVILPLKSDPAHGAIKLPTYVCDEVYVNSNTEAVNPLVLESNLAFNSTQDRDSNLETESSDTAKRFGPSEFFQAKNSVRKQGFVTLFSLRKNGCAVNNLDSLYMISKRDHVIPTGSADTVELCCVTKTPKATTDTRIRSTSATGSAAKENQDMMIKSTDSTSTSKGFSFPLTKDFKSGKLHRKWKISHGSEKSSGVLKSNESIYSQHLKDIKKTLKKKKFVVSLKENKSKSNVSVVVKIDRSNKSRSKKVKVLRHCTCGSVSLPSACSCGHFAIASNLIWKFKIPRLRKLSKH